MFRTFDIPLSWSELIKRTVKEVQQDNCLGLAAQLAFYFLLALVPAIVCVTALASFFPPNLIQNVLTSMGGVVPGDVLTILNDQLTNIAGKSSSGLFTAGLLMALWSSSAAMVGICDAMNRAYDVEEGRPWWKVRLTAMLLTIALAVFIVLSFSLVMVGPTVAERVAANMGFDQAFAFAWTILQWPVIFVVIAIGIGLVNYYAPDVEQDWEWITPGSILSTILWLIASLGFKIYVSNFANYNETYGSLGGIVVLMFWFYLTGLSILVGTELNAEIEHASPHGKDVGEKVPGEKRKIGAAAARAYEERKRKQQAGVLEPETMAFPQHVPGKHQLEPQPSLVAYGIVALGLFTRLKSAWRSTPRPSPQGESPKPAAGR